MTRPAFNASLEVRQQYLSLVFQKIPGEADWTLIDQGRVFTPSAEAEMNQYRRIGDRTTFQVPGSITTNVEMELYVENDIEELARALGVRMGAGWTGSEVVELDPEFIADYKVVNYDGITTTSNVVFTEYVNRFRPQRLSLALEAEGDVRVATISGVAESYYIMPEATAP